jgi:hypothetical protein
MGGVRSQTTGESEAYCSNPATTNLPKEFESRVNIIEKIPEMKTVTQTDHVKKLEEREELRTVPKTRVVEEQKQVTHNVPEVKEIPRTREETRYRVVEEKVAVPYTEKVVENRPVTKTVTVPKVVTENVQERITVPHVTEVPVERQVQVPTGKYCEQSVDQYTQPGNAAHMGTVGTGHQKLTRTSSSSSSSSSSSDDESGGPGLKEKIKSKLPGHKKKHGAAAGTGVGHTTGMTGTTGMATTGTTGMGHTTGTGLGHTTGTGLGHTTGTGLGNTTGTTGVGHTGLGHRGLGHHTGEKTATEHAAGLAGTGVAAHTPGTNPMAPGHGNLTGRPAPGEVGTGMAGHEEHEKKGFLKKIGEKLTGHSS